MRKIVVTLATVYAQFSDRLCAVSRPFMRSFATVYAQMLLVYPQAYAQRTKAYGKKTHAGLRWGMSHVKVFRL